MQKFKALFTVILLGFTVVCLQPQLLNKIHHYYVGSNVFKMTRLYHQGSGTGFLIKAKSGKTYIMTNNHVCNMEEGDYLKAKHQFSGKTFVTKILHRSKRHDLCLLEKPKDLPIYVRGLRLANNVKTGDVMTVVGHPLGNPLTVSRGEVIGNVVIELILGVNLPDEKCFGKNIKAEDLDPIQKAFLDARGIKTICVVRPLSAMNTSITFPGNSGSPAINHNFRVTGVLFAGRVNMATQSYVVPLEYLKEFLEGK